MEASLRGPTAYTSVCHPDPPVAALSSLWSQRRNDCEPVHSPLCSTAWPQTSRFLLREEVKTEQHCCSELWRGSRPPSRGFGGDSKAGREGKLYGGKGRARGASWGLWARGSWRWAEVGCPMGSVGGISGFLWLVLSWEQEQNQGSCQVLATWDS